MKALLLSAPAKTTDEVNWSKPLNQYLLSVYGNTSEFQDDLVNLNELRRRVQENGPEEAPDVALFLNYYSQLELLDLRIPMAQVNKRKPVKFTWNDAFSPKEEYTQSALPFEKASVLFNLGSALMRASALKYSDAQRNSDETGETLFKDSIKCIQQAAGVFQYLSESFLHGPLMDLKPSTIKFLSALCLAQSQEMFTLKVVDGDLAQKKNSLISKLCASAAKLYEECLGDTAHLVNADGTSAHLDTADYAIKEAGLDEESLTIDGEDDEELADYDPESSEAKSTKVYALLNASWVAIFRTKHLYYKALSFYFQGLQLEATSKFGEAIAYLTKSSQFLSEITPTLLKAVAKSRGHNVYDLLDNLEYQKDALRIKLADLIKDNDLIYHDIVPSLVTLAEPKPMNSSKVIPMNKIEEFVQVNEKNYSTFLSNVVPVSIHELLSFYSEEKSQFLRNEIDAVDVSNEEMSSALEFLNLPHALVSVKELTRAEPPVDLGTQSFQLDAESLEKVREISSKFSQNASNREQIAQIRKRIYDCVSLAENTLNSAPSGTAHGQFREDLIKLKRSLYDAANSDSRLFALIDQEHSAFYLALGKGVGSQEFNNLFLMLEEKLASSQNHEPEVSLLDLDDSQMSKLAFRIEDKITRLEDILNDLNMVKTNKIKLIAELKKEIHEDDISDILLVNSKMKSNNEIKSVIFPEELRKFDVYLNSLNKLIEQQKILLSEVKLFWDELISNPKVKKIQTSSTYRNGLLQEQKGKIEGFYENNWRKYTVGLQKGVGFYQQLLDYAAGLKGAIERQTQPQMGQFTQSMGSLNLGQDYTGGSMNLYSSQNASQYSAPLGPPKAQQGWSSQNTPGQGQEQSPYQQPQFSGFAGMSAQLNTSYNSATNAPQLPPKRPSQSSIPGQFGSFGNAPAHSNTSAPPAQPAAGFGSGSRPSGSSGSSSGLIYDQPSTYQPDMYDFFTQNRG